MRDQDFCQRLKQIRQKYGYADNEKVQIQTLQKLSPTKSPPIRHHYVPKPLSFNEHFENKPQIDLSYDQRFKREINLNSGRSHHISPSKACLTPELSQRYKAGKVSEDIESAKKYQRTSFHCDPVIEYPKHLDYINSSPIKKLDQKSNFEHSPYKEMSPNKANIPVSTLSPYNRPRPQSKQEDYNVKSGRSGYSHHQK